MKIRMTEDDEPKQFIEVVDMEDGRVRISVGNKMAAGYVYLQREQFFNLASLFK